MKFEWYRFFHTGDDDHWYQVCSDNFDFGHMEQQQKFFFYFY